MVVAAPIRSGTGRNQGLDRHRNALGLARLLKSHSLHRAAEAGATRAITDNDETNAPMLAVNKALGYRPRDVYGCDLLLLRPELHVVWRGNRLPDDPARLAALATGR